MRVEALASWQRARGSLRAAKALVDVDADSAVSRAYYAAFHAASAVFLQRGMSFRKHSALEAAIHRDLVKAGHWSAELGAAFKSLVDLRRTGDYGGPAPLTSADARKAVEFAEQILGAVAAAQPELENT